MAFLNHPMGCAVSASRFYIEHPDLTKGGKASLYKHLGFDEQEIKKLFHVFQRVMRVGLYYAMNAAEAHQQKRRKGYARVADIMHNLVDEERSRFADTVLCSFAKSSKALARQTSRTGVLLQKSSQGTGCQIDFHSFVLAMWNFLTVTRQQMGSWIFDLYDTDESAFLELSELKSMMMDIHGPGYMEKKECLVLMHIITYGNIASIDCRLDHNLFCDFVRDHHIFLQPAFRYRDHTVH